MKLNDTQLGLYIDNLEHSCLVDTKLVTHKIKECVKRDEWHEKLKKRYKHNQWIPTAFNRKINYDN